MRRLPAKYWETRLFEDPGTLMNYDFTQGFLYLDRFIKKLKKKFDSHSYLMIPHDPEAVPEEVKELWDYAVEKAPKLYQEPSRLTWIERLHLPNTIRNGDDIEHGEGQYGFRMTQIKCTILRNYLSGGYCAYFGFSSVTDLQSFAAIDPWVHGGYTFDGILPSEGDVFYRRALGWDYAHGGDIIPNHLSAYEGPQGMFRNSYKGIGHVIKDVENALNEVRDFHAQWK